MNFGEVGSATWSPFVIVIFDGQQRVLHDIGERLPGENDYAASSTSLAEQLGDRRTI